MTEDPSPGVDRVRALVLEVIASDAHLDPALRSGVVLDPVPIRAPDGRVVGWLVGITEGARLAGLLQLDEKLQLKRVASFTNRSDAPGEHPADWFDPLRVLARARSEAGEDEVLATPVLSYDGSLDRIAWRVVAKAQNGRTRTIYVVGDSAYSPAPSSGESER